VRVAALLLTTSALGSLAAGCGGGSDVSPAGRKLQREDLLAVSHALQGLEGQVGAEVRATKAAWPMVADGLPRDATRIDRTAIAAAAASAAAIALPDVLQEQRVVSLTGPAAELAGLFRSYALLSVRGWKLIGAALGQIEHGAPEAARFARQNAPLYIESVYDGHFILAKIGNKLSAAYDKLGGPAAFGMALSKREVKVLGDAYSEARDRLHPHVGVRLGS
jgi:hypothetical protein